MTIVTTQETLLEVREISVRFGGLVAVDKCSLGFKEGTVTGIIGPNGAGKSTLMNMIGGIIRPSSGSVHFNGKDVTGVAPYALARLGLVRSFQIARVFGRMSVLDNLLSGVPHQRGDHLLTVLLGPKKWRQQECEAEAKAMELLRSFDLDVHASQRCDELSGGQRRIVEYLRVLMTEPRVLLLDEPSVGLAPWLVEKLAADLRRLAEQNCCVLLIEHEMDLVRQASDNIIGMVNGKVVVSGTFEEVVANEMLQDAYLGRS